MIRSQRRRHVLWWAVLLPAAVIIIAAAWVGRQIAREPFESSSGVEATEAGS